MTPQQTAAQLLANQIGGFLSSGVNVDTSGKVSIGNPYEFLAKQRALAEEKRITAPPVVIRDDFPDLPDYIPGGDPVINVVTSSPSAPISQPALILPTYDATIPLSDVAEPRQSPRSSAKEPWEIEVEAKYDDTGERRKKVVGRESEKDEEYRTGGKGPRSKNRKAQKRKAPKRKAKKR